MNFLTQEQSPDDSMWVPPEDDTWDATNPRWRDIRDIVEEAEIMMQFYSSGRGIILPLAFGREEFFFATH